MPMEKLKTFKLTTIAVIVVAMTMMLVEGTGLAVQDDGSARRGADRFEFAGVSTPLGERAGTDDGPAFAIHFTGDTHGSLDACG
jgi:hypothetical protein